LAGGFGGILKGPDAPHHPVQIELAFQGHAPRRLGEPATAEAASWSRWLRFMAGKF
jgi:hypothetical protein